MNQFNLPDVGEGLTEAEIVTWKVKVGDVIKVNDVIVDIETAKSLVELPSPYEGTIEELLVQEGATVDVGTPIIRINDGTESAVQSDDDADSETHSESSERNPVLVGYGPRTGATKRRARKSAVASVDTDKTAGAVVDDPQPPAEPAQPVDDSTQSRPAHVLAKPPVRKLAKDLGVDLARVPAVGEVITRADVEAYAKQPANSSVVESDRGRLDTLVPRYSTTDSQGIETNRTDTRIPIKGVRKMTAEAMVKSAFTAPHVTEWVTLDVTKTMELLERLKADKSYAGLRVSPLLLIAKAVCLAIRKTPELNSTWDEEAQEIVLKGSVNLGIAAATPRGLVVPNIVGAESKSMPELAGDMAGLIATAREGKTQPAQMSGGTFTITNIGVFGIDAGTPILNPGESGILAVGAINKRPWVDENDDIVARWVTTLALSFDHRVVDGEQGSRFLADVASILNSPDLALTF